MLFSLMGCRNMLSNIWQYLKIKNRKWTCKCFGNFIDVEAELEGVAAQEDDDDEDEGVGDGDLALLLPVHRPDVLVPLVDDAADAKVEEGEGGEGKEAEEDGGENHGE